MRGILISVSDRPLDWTTFNKAIVKAWQTEQQAFEDEGCEISLVVIRI